MIEWIIGIVIFVIFVTLWIQKRTRDKRNNQRVSTEVAKMRDLTEKARVGRLFQQGMVSQPSRRVRDKRRKSTFRKFKSSMTSFGSKVASRRHSKVSNKLSLESKNHDLKSSGRSSRLSSDRRSSSRSSRSSSDRRSFRIKRSAGETLKVKSLTLTVDDSCCSDVHIFHNDKLEPR